MDIKNGDYHRMWGKILKILERGNTVEVRELKHEIVIFEKKLENRISFPKGNGSSRV